MRNNWPSIDMCPSRILSRISITNYQFLISRKKSLRDSESLFGVTTSSVEVGWVVLTTRIIIESLVNIWVFWPTKGVVWPVIWVGERVLNWYSFLSTSLYSLHSAICQVFYPHGLPAFWSNFLFLPVLIPDYEVLGMGSHALSMLSLFFFMYLSSHVGDS